jgi:hypothetical protein
MSDPTPEATPDGTGSPETAAQPEPVDQTDWKAEARKWETRAKENGAAANELKRQRQASMTEAEKAVAEAEQRGRQSAAEQYGQRLVRSDFMAAAARRNPGYDAAGILDDLNLARYVGDDGEPDVKAIEKAVGRLIPAASNTPPPLDLGVGRTATSAPSMNDLIRKAAGRA